MTCTDDFHTCKHKLTNVFFPTCRLVTVNVRQGTTGRTVQCAVPKVVGARSVQTCATVRKRDCATTRQVRAASAVLPGLRGSDAKTDVLRVCLDSIATRTACSSVRAAVVIVSSAFANVQLVSSASLATFPALKTRSVATVLKPATVTGSSQPDVTLL